MGQEGDQPAGSSEQPTTGPAEEERDKASDGCVSEPQFSPAAPIPADYSQPTSQPSIEPARSKFWQSAAPTCLFVFAGIGVLWIAIQVGIRMGEDRSPEAEKLSQRLAVARALIKEGDEKASHMEGQLRQEGTENQRLREELEAERATRTDDEITEENEALRGRVRLLESQRTDAEARRIAEELEKRCGELAGMNADLLRRMHSWEEEGGTPIWPWLLPPAGLLIVVLWLGLLLTRGRAREGYPLASREFDLGMDAGRAGDNEGALAAFSRAIELEPDDADAWYNKGVALAKLRRTEEARSAYDRAIELRPEYADAWYNKGVALAKLATTEEALNAFERAIELKPEDAEMWSAKGGALGKLERMEQALAACERAIELKPEYAEAWSNKGAAISSLGRAEDALVAYDRAIELKPEYAEAWFNKGAALHKLGKTEEALAAFERAIDLNPDDADPWSSKGVALAELGRSEEALAACERAIELNPDDPDVWFNKAFALNELGRTEQALAAYERALELKPEHPEAWFNKACALCRASAPKSDVLGALERAIALDGEQKADARRDEDFQSLWDDPDFIALTKED